MNSNQNALYFFNFFKKFIEYKNDTYKIINDVKSKDLNLLQILILNSSDKSFKDFLAANIHLFRDENNKNF